MSTRGLLAGVPVLEVDVSRFEDLCNTEARFEIISAYIKSDRELDRKLLRLMCGEVSDDE